MAAREPLASLLPGISDPFLHAVSQLAIAWALPIAGDLDGALRGWRPRWRNYAAKMSPSSPPSPRSAPALRPSSPRQRASPARPATACEPANKAPMTATALRRRYFAMLDLGFRP